MSEDRKGLTNKNKRKPQKLTAAERRRIEREQRRQSLGDDPLAAFTTDDLRPSPPSIGESIENFGGVPNFGGSPDDDYSRLFGEAPDPKERRERRKEREPELRIKPASSMTRRQRRTRMFVVYVSVFLITVAVAVILSMTVVFRTTEIRVEAEGLPYSDEEIIETSGLSYNDNIFMSKRKAAAKKLTEVYPYVEGVEIGIKVPGTQIIRIDVAVPSYQVQFSGGFAVVSEKNRILEINSKQKNEVPLLKGLKLRETGEGEYITFEKEATKQILDEVITNINDNDLGNIYGIDISNAANIELNYDNRITILLGLPEDVGYKLRTAKAIINQSLYASDKGTLDVSIANTDRRSSYFTPIYSDAVSVAGETSSETSSQTYEASEFSRSDDEYLGDIID